MAKSIIQNRKECLICKDEGVLHKHHVFPGVANRKLSEEYGCWCYLCPAHHNMSDYGVHFDHSLDVKIKEYTQRKFEEKYSREEFMRIFGKNYIMED